MDIQGWQKLPHPCLMSVKFPGDPHGVSCDAGFAQFTTDHNIEVQRVSEMLVQRERKDRPRKPPL